MSDPALIPHRPQRYTLLWPDAILDFQEAIAEMGITTPLYIVGGAVRDAFLHRLIVRELDLAAPDHSIEIARRIADHYDGDVYIMDAERAVARAMIETPEGRLIIDVARFRENDLGADLEGRDFTINAMACDLHGDLAEIIDPLGGEQDAETRWLRACRPSAIREDAVRALRAVRLATQLQFRIDRETMQDVRTATLDSVSPERVRDEFFKILHLPTVRQAIRVSTHLGLTQQIVPETKLLDHHIWREGPRRGNEGWGHAYDVIAMLNNVLTTISYKRTDNTAASFDLGMLAIQLDRFRAQINEQFDLTWPDERKHTALIVLGGLLSTLPLGAEIEPIIVQRADALKLSAPERKRLAAMVNASRMVPAVDPQSRLSLHRYWYEFRAAGVDGVLIALATYLALASIDLVQDEWLAQVEHATIMLDVYFNRYESIVEPPALLSGHDLMERFDLEPGRVIGELLTVLREAQAAGLIESREDALQVAQEYLQNSADS